MFSPVFPVWPSRPISNLSLGGGVLPGEFGVPKELGLVFNGRGERPRGESLGGAPVTERCQSSSSGPTASFPTGDLSPDGGVLALSGGPCISSCGEPSRGDSDFEVPGPGLGVTGADVVNIADVMRRVSSSEKERFGECIMVEHFMV